MTFVLRLRGKGNTHKQSVRNILLWIKYRKYKNRGFFTSILCKLQHGCALGSGGWGSGCGAQLQHGCAHACVLQRAALPRTGRHHHPASRPLPQEGLQGLVKGLVPLAVAVQQQQNLGGLGQRRPQLLLRLRSPLLRKQSGYFLQQVTFDIGAVQMNEEADGAEIHGAGGAVRGPRGPRKGQELGYAALAAPRRSLQDQGLSRIWHQCLKTDRLALTDRNITQEIRPNYFLCWLLLTAWLQVCQIRQKRGSWETTFNLWDSLILQPLGQHVGGECVHAKPLLLAEVWSRSAPERPPIFLRRACRRAGSAPCDRKQALTGEVWAYRRCKSFALRRFPFSILGLVKENTNFGGRLVSALAAEALSEEILIWDQPFRWSRWFGKNRSDARPRPQQRNRSCEIQTLIYSPTA